jgi:excisionase family DNA binding protein
MMIDPQVSGAQHTVADYLTVKSIAKATKSSEAFWYKEIEAGRLECDRFGTLVRISPEQFERYRKRQHSRSAAEAA